MKSKTFLQLLSIDMRLKGKLSPIKGSINGDFSFLLLPQYNLASYNQMNNLDNWISIWIICFGAAWFPVITAPGEGLNSVFNVKVNALRSISTRLTLRGQVFDWDSQLQTERMVISLSQQSAIFCLDDDPGAFWHNDVNLKQDCLGCAYFSPQGQMQLWLLDNKNRRVEEKEFGHLD